MSLGYPQNRALIAHGVESVNFFIDSRHSIKNTLRVWRDLRRAVRKTAPDIVHAQYGSLAAFVAAVSTTRPLIVTFRGSDLNHDIEVHPVRSALQTFFSQVAALRAQGIICVSSKLADRLWWRRQRVTIVASGIDLSLFNPLDRSEARRQLGWPLDRYVVFFNAGIQPVTKRLDLAQAATQVASKRLGKPVELHILYGNTPVAQVPLIMNACDCLLFTSAVEASPRVIKEAMACNLPVVSVDVGDVRDRLADVEPSLIVPDSAETLGAAMVQIIQSGRRSNGRTKAHEMSVEAQAEKVIALYQKCLRPTKRASADSSRAEGTRPHRLG